ncbi:hypothetical protein D043_3867B, partial [Vibrio parahaemolyticus EKP-021]
TTLGVYEIKHD